MSLEGATRIDADSDLSRLGRRALRLHLTQHLFTRLSSTHPALLSQALTASSHSALSLDAILDTKTLGAGVGRAWRLEEAVRWREVRGPDGEMTGLYKCRGSAVEAVVGAVYTTQVSRAGASPPLDGPTGEGLWSARANDGLLCGSWWARCTWRPQLVTQVRRRRAHTPDADAAPSRAQGIDASAQLFEQLVLPHLSLPRSLAAALSGAAAPPPSSSVAQPAANGGLGQGEAVQA